MSRLGLAVGMLNVAVGTAIILEGEHPLLGLLPLVAGLFLLALWRKQK